MVLEKTTLLGFAAVALSLLSQEASDLSVQALQSAVPGFELSAIRFSGVLGLSAVWLIMRKHDISLNVNLFVLLTSASMASLVFNVLYFHAVSVLPLSHAGALLVCTRMIFFVIYAAVTKQIAFNIFNAITMIGCTVGVLMIVQPWVPFDEGFTSNVLVINESTKLHENDETDNHANTAVIFGYMALIASGAFSALYFYITAFYLRSVPSAIQCLITGSICLPSSLLISFYVEQPIITTNISDIVLVTVHALGTGTHIIAQNTSLLLLDPVLVPILFNIHAILGLIPQYTFMSPYLFGRRNVTEVLGCIVIFVCVSIRSLLSKVPVHEDLKM